MFKNFFMPLFQPYMAPDDGTGVTGGNDADPDDTDDLDLDTDDTGEEDDPEEDEMDPYGDESDEEDPADPPQAEKPKQSAEEDSKFAEMRRRHAEEKKQLLAQIEAERASKAQAIDEVVGTAFKGQINPYNSKPIQNQADYMEYQKMYRADMLEQLGLSPDYIDRMISNNPMVQQAAQIVQTQQMAAGKSAFDSQLAAISKINPQIQTVQDLMNMPEAEEFNHYVIDKKYEPLDAFRLVYKGQQKPKQNTAETKEHLIPTGGEGGGTSEVEIPASEIAVWKDAYPDETRAQLRARYNRALKRQAQ